MSTQVQQLARAYGSGVVSPGYRDAHNNSKRDKDAWNTVTNEQANNKKYQEMA